MDREVVLLKIRNAIASKESCVASANMETMHRDGWSCNWEIAFGELEREISGLFDLLGE